MLCAMIFARFHYLLETILQISFYTDPRAQRVCFIYGADATNMYAIKSIMVNESWIIVISSTFISLIMFSYQLRLFERVTNGHFIHFTSCMWNMFITMTTVGYGDIYAMSHPGRFIALVAAFWGVFLNSLFILSLTNSLNLSSSE
jgi:Ion channel